MRAGGQADHRREDEARARRIDHGMPLAPELCSTIATPNDWNTASGDRAEARLLGDLAPARLAFLAASPARLGITARNICTMIEAEMYGIDAEREQAESAAARHPRTC